MITIDVVPQIPCVRGIQLASAFQARSVPNHLKTPQHDGSTTIIVLVLDAAWRPEAKAVASISRSTTMPTTRVNGNDKCLPSIEELPDAR